MGVDMQSVSRKSVVIVFGVFDDEIRYLVVPGKDDFESVRWAFIDGLLGKKDDFTVFAAAISSCVRIDVDDVDGLLFIEVDVDVFRSSKEILELNK